ncbi:RNA polymerase sigma factor [Streptomyces himalayensis]|uniref:RNA polymerase sigma factor n=1 Tax=Streptomyces himalayensis TaxID=2820085 RepID=UPI0028681AC1|nr:sigma-70 family RNA polymerase sigma factor [Streptomyces himalayensis]
MPRPDRHPSPGRHDPEPTAPARTDPAAFRAFCDENFDALLGFVTRRVTDPHLAADLTADVFLAALEAADSFDPRRGAPRAWLYGIARNVLSGHFRSNARERDAVARLNGRRLLDEEDIAALEERIDAERAAREQAVRHRALSKPLREVVDLVAVDGLTPREAAAALGISLATVRVRLHRARRILRAVPAAPPPAAVPAASPAVRRPPAPVSTPSPTTCRPETTLETTP